jgi:hypothetical protein
MKRTISEWRETITTALTETIDERYYTAFCPICGLKEIALSEGGDEGKALARSKTELHIVSEHNDRIESPESHRARMAYLEELRKAIKATHDLESVHQDTVSVREVFQGKTAWEGDVEIFIVAGHSQATRCFAWGVRRDDDKGWDMTAVLGVPPIVSPQLAVKAGRQGRRPR